MEDIKNPYHCNVNEVREALEGAEFDLVLAIDCLGSPYKDHCGRVITFEITNPRLVLGSQLASDDSKDTMYMSIPVDPSPTEYGPKDIHDPGPGVREAEELARASQEERSESEAIQGSLRRSIDNLDQAIEKVCSRLTAIECSKGEQSTGDEALIHIDILIGRIEGLEARYRDTTKSRLLSAQLAEIMSRIRRLERNT